MTKKQLRKYRMYIAVIEYLNRNADILKETPYLINSFSEFRSIIDLIHITSLNQGVSRKGIAIEKKNCEKKLISITIATASKLAAWAKFNNNNLVLNQVQRSKSDLEDMKDGDLKTQAEIIYKEAESKIGILQEYGITSESQNILRASIDEFDRYFMMPRSGIIERSLATMHLKELMGKAYSVLLDMDIYIRIIMYEKPDFYTGYMTVRKLVHTRSGIVKLRVKVTEKGSVKTVKGAFLKFYEDIPDEDTKTSRADLVKKSALQGGLNIQKIKAGKYKVLISKPGYREQSISVTVNDNERTELAVEMEKI